MTMPGALRRRGRLFHKILHVNILMLNKSRSFVLWDIWTSSHYVPFAPCAARSGPFWPMPREVGRDQGRPPPRKEERGRQLRPGTCSSVPPVAERISSVE